MQRYIQNSVCSGRIVSTKREWERRIGFARRMDHILRRQWLSTSICSSMSLEGTPCAWNTYAWNKEPVSLARPLFDIREKHNQYHLAQRPTQGLQYFGVSIPGEFRCK